MPVLQVREAVELMQMEYAEMPAMSLTFQQAQRLWNFSAELCQRALDSLIGSGFLVRTADGRYSRKGGDWAAVQPPDASLVAMNAPPASE